MLSPRFVWDEVYIRAVLASMTRGPSFLAGHLGPTSLQLGASVPPIAVCVTLPAGYHSCVP